MKLTKWSLNTGEPDYWMENRWLISNRLQLRDEEEERMAERGEGEQTGEAAK